MRLLAIGPPQSGSPARRELPQRVALTDRSAANGRVSAAKAAVKEATADVDKAVAALGALSPETSSEVAPR